MTNTEKYAENHRGNIESDLLPHVLPDDSVGKITRRFPFVLVNTSRFLDSLDPGLYKF